MNFSGRKVDVLTAGLENNQDNKPVIIFENGRGSSYNSWEYVERERT